MDSVIFEWPDFVSPAIQLMLKFAISLILGALVGVEREFHFTETERSYFAGVRTFPFFALLGCIAALTSAEILAWFFPVSFMAFAILISISYVVTSESGGKGITTESTSMLVFLVGAMVYWDYMIPAAAVTVLITAVLSMKEVLHNLADRIEQEDIYATLKFALITVVILPLLPNRAFGPLEVLNPFHIWLMVVFISGISFSGYIMIKLIGAKRGIGATGLLGGLISSTAVSLSFSQRSKEQKGFSHYFAFAIILASTTMYPRLLLETAVLNTELCKKLALPLLLITVAGIGVCIFLWFRKESDGGEEEMEFSNPFRFGPALKFGLLFAVILFTSKASRMFIGEKGLLITGFLSGLADSDAITVSMTRLAGKSVDYDTAALVVILASAANTLIKGGIPFFLGSANLKRKVLPGIFVLEAATLLTCLFFI